MRIIIPNNNNNNNNDNSMPYFIFVSFNGILVDNCFIIKSSLCLIGSDSYSEAEHNISINPLNFVFSFNDMLNNSIKRRKRRKIRKREREGEEEEKEKRQTKTECNQLQ